MSHLSCPEISISEEVEVVARRTQALICGTSASFLPCTILASVPCLSAAGRGGWGPCLWPSPAGDWNWLMLNDHCL